MKKRCLLSLLALTTAAASGQQPALQGARVTGLQGQVQVKESTVWRLLREGEQLAESTLLKLAEGSHLSLRYRADGHREEAEGPGQLIVGTAGGQPAGGLKVERFGFKNRPLQIPRSGGMDAVGGSVANASKTTPPPPPDMVRPAAPITPVFTPRGSESSPQFTLTAPAPPPLALSWEARTPNLVNPGAGGIQLNPFRGQVIVFEQDVELARLPVANDQPVGLEHFAVHEGSLYRLQLEDEGVPKGSLTFRLLDPEESQELLELTTAEAITPEQRLERMDRFSALGQYHLAAEEGKRWLLGNHLDESPQEAAAVLQVVYDLNRDILRDPRQTEYWKDWARMNKLSLVE